jgi:hypothetical protein
LIRNCRAIYLRFKVRPFLHISIYLTCSAAAMNHIQIRISPYSYESMLFIVRHIPAALHHKKGKSWPLSFWYMSASTLLLVHSLRLTDCKEKYTTYRLSEVLLLCFICFISLIVFSLVCFYENCCFHYELQKTITLLPEWITYRFGYHLTVTSQCYLSYVTSQQPYTMIFIRMYRHFLRCEKTVGR